MSWTPVMITSMVLAFLLIVVFGLDFFNQAGPGTERTVSVRDGRDSERFYDHQTYETVTIGSERVKSGGFEDYQIHEVVTISGAGGSRTVDHPDKIVELVISGMNNYVTVTKRTEISAAILSGTDNRIYLCEDVHYPNIVKSGVNNGISYVNC